MPLKKILNDSNGQMQIAITNETGQFSERFACSSVGGVWYGLFSFESSSGSDLCDGKVFVLQAGGSDVNRACALFLEFSGFRFMMCLGS